MLQLRRLTSPGLHRTRDSVLNSFAALRLLGPLCTGSFLHPEFLFMIYNRFMKLSSRVCRPVMLDSSAYFIALPCDIEAMSVATIFLARGSSQITKRSSSRRSQTSVAVSAPLLLCLRTLVTLVESRSEIVPFGFVVPQRMLMHCES